MNNEIKKDIDDTIKNEFGITCMEYDALDFNLRKEVMYQSIKQKNKTVKVMIGSGEDAMFTEKQQGEKYMLEDGTIVRAGNTLNKSRNKLGDRLDDVVYSDPVALVKKLVRRIKKK